VALVHEWTMPTKQPPLVGEVSVNFCGQRGVAWSVRRIPYGRNLGFLDRTSLEHSHNSHNFHFLDDNISICNDLQSDVEMLFHNYVVTPDEHKSPVNG
jgi:hypothetical protein